jgi:hypothetical protein
LRKQQEYKDRQNGAMAQWHKGKKNDGMGKNKE